MKEKIPELDWLRGIAAILVLLFHYTVRYPESVGSSINYWVSIKCGAAGVNVFFFLSGFLTLFVMKNSEKATTYLKKRVKRLYPEYWCCLSISVIIEFFFFKDFFPGWKNVIVNYTMLQDFINAQSVDGAYWTLAYELRFYIYIFIILLFNRRKLFKPMCQIWVICSLVGYYLNSGNILEKIFNYFFMPQFCAAFASGIFVYYIYKDSKDFKCWISLLLACVLSYLQQDRYYFAALIISIIYSMSILFIRDSARGSQYKKIITLMSNTFMKPLQFIAKISFPLYLIHQYVGYCILQKLELCGLSNGFIIIIPILITIALANFIHYLSVEVKNEIFKRNKGKN